MIGQTISHYEILEKLGEGGMGVVYKARDTRLDRFVALKFLPSQFTQDKERRERFITEAKAASALDHPNICTIHEINETDNGQLYICMAFYEGQTLKEKIKDKSLSGLGMETGLKIKEIHDYTIQIAQGLQRAHEKGIIHRDIKPANIMITGRGEVKILDFGLAKLAGAERTESISTKGTIAYMSPEIIRGLPVDQRSDIWSLGVVLYEMLTGERPFKGDYAEPMMYAILNEVPESIGNYREDLPGSFKVIFEKMLQKDPAKRYQNLDKFISDSGNFKPESADSNKRIIQRGANRIPVKKIAAIGIILFLLIGMFILYNKIIKSGIIKKIPIAVISFANLTGEKKYDYLQSAIPNLLITNLEQSGYLRVATWERLNDLLRQEGIKDSITSDPVLGFQICRRDGIQTIVLGSYTKAGEVFALDIKILDVQSKELLRSASSRGYGISSILTSQIDELSENIFRELHVPKTTDETTQPISKVTTTSIEAYQYYIRGKQEFEKRNVERSRQFFEKAVKLDTTFASAYYNLARVYYWLQSTKAGREAMQNAKNHISRTTEKEKLYIEAGFAEFLGNNSEERFNRLHQLTEKYPQEKQAHLDLAQFCYARKKLYSQAVERILRVIELDPDFGLAYNMLAFVYMEMGEYDKALETFRYYAALNPGDANVFDSTGELYLRMGKLDQALVKYKEATEVEPSYFYAYRTIAYIYALREDYHQSIKWISQYIKIAPSDGIKARGHVYRGFYYFWLGRIQQSLKELVIASKYYEAVESENGLAYIDWVRGWIYFFKGDFIKGLKHSRLWLDTKLRHNLELTQLYQAEFNFYCGLTNLRDAEFDSAKSILRGMKKILLQIDLENKDRINYYYDIMNVEFLLSQDSIEKATSISDTLSPLQIPLIHPTRLVTYNLPFPNVRDFSVRAYHLNGDLNRAISENEKLITLNPKSKELRLIHPTYYFRLAKLYEENGQFDSAKNKYEKFLKLWNQADEGLPEFIEAKKCLIKFKTIQQ